MLALAYAAEHPQSIGPLILVGCGTFDLHGRARMHETVAQRMSTDVRKRLERVPCRCIDLIANRRGFMRAGERFIAKGWHRVPLAIHLALDQFYALGDLLGRPEHFMQQDRDLLIESDTVQ